ncbi:MULTISPECIES: hypothetical protein [unclassified Brevundimonas]|uniref:hypothetical protein n=1 Tax=unclassified Brevundimonas TaxID=2622653 RepID=UPI0006F89803|nr:MULTISPECIES: hypothetical protein [unclassified Brevundimonas]KQY85735.1 hypothetical protein ASD25_23555 [Brevundimonas sp. Root1423]KRA26498.1 hypothetical protein ASD59_08425 [Brevundimonas sp. Root608]
MARRAIRTDRLIAVLGAAVLLLGAVIVWGAVRTSRPGVVEEPPARRVLRQAREQLGRTAEIRLLDEGRGRVVCGYVGRRGESAAYSFISRPNRIMMSDDPLATEFQAMLRADCPHLPRPPATTP